MYKTGYDVRRQGADTSTKKVKKYIAEPLHRVLLYFILFSILFIHIIENNIFTSFI